MDNIEMAQEGLEHAHHGHGGDHQPDRGTRRAAMMIAILAAAAVIGEMAANDSQTHYLAAHIAASDCWTQYQAKSVRKAVYTEAAAALDVAGPASATAAAAARTDAARMQSEPGGDGMEQLAAKAKHLEEQRDEALEHHERLERGVRGLQIAIVLSSLFVVTKLRWLLFLGGGLGAVAAIYAVVTAL